MFGRPLNRDGAEQKICPDCRGKLTVVRRCPYVAMRCQSCGAVHEFRDVADQIDDPLEEDLGWMPMDRL